MPLSFPPGAVPANLPADIRLQIVTPCAQPPDGDGWLNEIKYDGHRLVAIMPGVGSLKLLSRNGHDRTPLFRGPFRKLASSGRRIVLDGEIAVPDERGVTHIDLLQAASGRYWGRSPRLLRVRPSLSRRARFKSLPHSRA